MSARLLFTAALLLAACEREPTPADETAAELRALRVFLQQQPAARGHATDGADPRTAIAEALAPLREVVTTLARAQDEQAARQLALTQEMQRWSQLLVENVGGAHAGDAKAMTARLQQLEQAMRDQDARHRESEALMQGALERTADRLQEFLRLLDAPAANAPPSSSPAPGGAGTSPGKATGNTTVDPVPGGAPPRNERSSSSGRVSAGGLRAEQWLWLALATVALAVGAFFVRRSRRGAPLRHGGSLAAPSARAPIAHEHDPGVDEIWAAAALLGETVNRLRQTGGAAPGAPAPPSQDASDAPAETVPGELQLDEVFVLDDFEARPPEKVPATENGMDRSAVAANGLASKRPAATATAPAGVAIGRAPARGPDLVVCRLATSDVELARTTAANVLAGDPRVLRRPAPSVVAAGKAVEVTFATLPGLAAGERSLLEQRLRDAVG